jgi:hypothetical protein
MQAKNLKVAVLVTFASLLVIFTIEALAKEIILFSEEENWGWIKAAEFSDENPYQGQFAIKVDTSAGGWVNHGPHDIPNGDLSEFEDDAGNLPVDEVFIEFYYDVGQADVGYWEVTFQLGGDWANKIDNSGLGAELDAEEGYQLFRIPLRGFGPDGWWETMPRVITAMQLGASFPQGASVWLDELRVTDGKPAAVSTEHRLATTWGKLKSR